MRHLKLDKAIGKLLHSIDECLNSFIVFNRDIKRKNQDQVRYFYLNQPQTNVHTTLLLL